MLKINGAKKTLGLSIICKNEVEEFDTLFRSIPPIFNEIVIVLTGDNPETEKQAKKYGTKVVRFKWVDDFSKARQFSFDENRCDFIMWIDMDDTLLGGLKLKEVCEEAFAMPHIYSIYMPYEYDHDEYGNVAMTLWRERIVRKQTHKWRGALHESLLPTVDGQNFRTEKVAISHNVDKDRVVRSGLRNFQISQKQYLKDREVTNIPDPRNTLNYARSLEAIGKFKEAIPVFEEFLRESEWDDERYQVFLSLCELYSNSKQYHKGVDMALQAIRLRPLYGQSYYKLAKIYFHLEKWPEVIHFCEIGGRSICPRDILPVDPTQYSLKPLILYEQACFRIGNAEKALSIIQAGLKQFPDSEILIEHQKLVVGYMKRMQLEESAQNLLDWVEKEDEKKVLGLLESLPKVVQDHPRFVRKANELGDQLLRHVTGAGSRVVIFCGPTFETWDPDTAKTQGLGGSEEAVVYLSKELVKLGWVVDVYNNIDQPNQFDGVNYYNFWTYDKKVPCDVFIAWRNSEYLEEAPKGSKKYMWLHDVQKDEYWTPERLKVVEKIFCLSKWHRDNFKKVPDDKFFLTRNGIIPSQFSAAGEIQRDSFKCVYASSPDRGLDVLLEMWPEIIKKAPDAHLHVFYGFSPTYDKLHANNDRMIEFKEVTLKKMEDLEGVHYHGKVNHAELHEHFMSAGLWLYPTYFTEISCITAMKAQVAGMIPVTMTLAALDETVQHGYKVDFAIQDTRARTAFINITVDLLKDPKKQEKKRLPMMKWSKDYFSWSKVAEEWSDLFKCSNK